MKYHARLLLILLSSVSLHFAACAPVEPPQPPQDPTKEQIVLLQKQLLELQKVQNDTKAKLDESLSTIEILNEKLKALEENPRPKPTPAAAIEPKPEAAPKVEPEKKPETVKPAEKKKPVKKSSKKKKKKKTVKKQAVPQKSPEASAVPQKVPGKSEEVK